MFQIVPPLSFVKAEVRVDDDAQSVPLLVEDNPEENGVLGFDDLEPVLGKQISKIDWFYIWGFVVLNKNMNILLWRGKSYIYYLNGLFIKEIQIKIRCLWGINSH